MAVLSSRPSRAVLAVFTVGLVAASGIWAGSARAERDIGRLCPPSIATDGRFSDVPSAYVHAVGIYCIAEAGITIGTTATTFSPDAPVSRGQMATFLRRLLDGTTRPVPAASAVPGDVTGNEHASAIAALLAAGVIPPQPGPFRPDEPIRRDEMAGWMHGTWTWLAGTELAADGQPFHDLGGNPYAADVAALYVHGVINGKLDGYDPGGPVTRGQMGSFLARLMVMHADAGHLPEHEAVTTTTVVATTSTTAPAASGLVRVPEAEAQILAHHNEGRAAYGSPPMARNGCLDEMASEWSRGLAEGGTAGRPDDPHRTLADMGARSKACLPGTSNFGENIAWNVGVTGILAFWEQSQGHASNILNPAWDNVGIGVWRDAEGYLWATVNFVDG